ncbi:MAG: DEAD/DEAH box helicase [Candidatus Aphodosoma sp.]
MYSDIISKYSPLTIDAVIETAKVLLPSAYNSSPWSHPEVNHGVGLLETEDGLNCYIAAYGESHKRKVFMAIEDLPFAELRESIEVVDWGCGQGLASVCLAEKMRERNLIQNLKQITLIEPSSAAINRAKLNVSLAAPEAKLTTLQLGLPPTICLDFDCISEIVFREPITIHLFSNILDIETIDLKRLAELITSTGHKHYVLCIGPANRQEDRINAFCRYFQLSPSAYFSNYRNTEFFTRTDYNKYTFGCFLKSFEYRVDQGEQILIPYRFYAPKQYFAAYKSDMSTLDVSKIETAFEVLAPFDIGASVYDDVSPILAVLNNIVERGLPTKASPWLENLLMEVLNAGVKDEEEALYGGIRFLPNKDISQESIQLVKDIPLAVARIEKTILEALLTKQLSLDKGNWNVLVKEADVPYAAIALHELAEMLNHLASASQDYAEMHFPEIKLSVINSNYSDSRLHPGANVYSSSCKQLTDQTFDIVIDFSLYEKSNPRDVEFSQFKANNNCYFNVRASESIYSERYIYTSDRIVYKPLTKLNQQGTHDNIEDNVAHLRYFIQLLFRKENFREGQLPIISRALQLKSVIGLLPTGGGKSLTYQIAAMLQPGVTIIIDPLMSLMKDQYDGLLKNGIDFCTFINSAVQNKAERENMMKDSKLLFVFLSPERLAIFKFRESLRAMADNHVYFSYGIIDEVHCVSEWGHDFRFTYLHLGRNLYNYVLPKRSEDESRNHITLVGLTATASFDVLADVERELSGNNAFPLDPEATVRYENTNRLELQYRIVKVDDETAHDKWDVYSAKNMECPRIIKDCFYSSLQELLKPESIERIKKRFIERENIEPTSDFAQSVFNRDLNVNVNPEWYSNPGDVSSAIVFCPHRQGTLGVHNGSRIGIAGQIKETLNIRHVSEFVGGDDPSSQDEFIQNRTNIMVATKAFGMGIDKPHVRFTLNVNHSGSLEAFVQEAGRAGRDRKIALAVVLYSDRVFNEQDEFTRLIEPVKVDFGVHKFFYDANFLGENTEWTVMDYLMNHQMTITEEPDEISRQNKTVTGFLSKLNQVAEGEAVVSYISYRYPSRDSETLDGYLRQANLRTFTQQPKNPKANTAQLRDLNQEQYQAALMKAIYRMCCIGLIEDFTQDYINQEFRIVTRKKPEGAYYEGLKQFFMRYYNETRANAQIAYCKRYNGSEIANCLYFLTQFIYKKIATKRKQAILDIEQFCEEATSGSRSWLDTNEELKDILYYYFNSKYARHEYKDENGKDFSLIDDTQSGREWYFNGLYADKDSSMGADFEKSILAKYISIINIDGTSSPKDNIKHLRGAVRLIRRGILSTNPTLSLLNVFCLLFLKADETSDSLNNEVETSFIEAYEELRKNLSQDQLSNYIKKYFDYLAKYKITDQAHIEHFGLLIMMCEAVEHAEWAHKFKEHFTT